ncbi:PASTA domain-containing protein [Lentzea sp. NPDC058450]|uniref:PASTA domain-containing protein n=1 Tax=Lentzea sp. NPDC058450 TaxID=3346505 RepID=UPI00365026BE
MYLRLSSATVPESVTDLSGLLLERRYRLDAVLERGAMSTVYRGRDVRLDRAIAVEVMNSPVSSAPAFLARFEREARAAAHLRHPAVVAVHDQCVEGDQVYLVMELVEGGSLRDLLAQRGGLPPAVALSVLGPVLSALGAAHRAGLVHGDVRPENVLIGEDGQVKVARFGLLRAMGGDIVAGAVAWQPPGQAVPSTPDARGDVCSAGGLLYEVLTGKTLSSGEGPALVAPWQRPEVPADPVLPVALNDLVLRATQRDPALRHADATAFLEDLERVGHELGLRPQPVPLPGTPPDEDRTMIMSPVPVAVGAAASSTAEVTARLRSPSAPSRPRQARPARPRPEKIDPAEQRRRRTRRRVGIGTSVVAVVAVVAGLSWWWLGAERRTAVPEIGGQTETSALAQVRDASLSAQVVRVPSNDVPNGNVLRTEPSTGTELLENSSITVYVSRGRPVVPFLTAGAEVDVATKEIEASGLKAVADETKKAFSDTVPPGKLVAVEPRPGTQLRIDDQVTLVLSKGPAPKKPVPNLTNMTKDEALAELQRNGLEAVEAPAEFSAAVDGGRVVRTDPPAGTVLGPDQKSASVVLSNAVSMPEVRGKSIRDARAQLQALGLQVNAVSPNGDDAPCAAQSVEPAQRVQPGSAITIAGG